MGNPDLEERVHSFWKFVWENYPESHVPFLAEAVRDVLVELEGEWRMRIPAPWRSGLHRLAFDLLYGCSPVDYQSDPLGLGTPDWTRDELLRALEARYGAPLSQIVSDLGHPLPQVDDGLNHLISDLTGSDPGYGGQWYTREVAGAVYTHEGLDVVHALRKDEEMSEALPKALRTLAFWTRMYSGNLNRYPLQRPAHLADLVIQLLRVEMDVQKYLSVPDPHAHHQRWEYVPAMLQELRDFLSQYQDDLAGLRPFEGDHAKALWGRVGVWGAAGVATSDAEGRRNVIRFVRWFAPRFAAKYGNETGISYDHHNTGASTASPVLGDYLLEHLGGILRSLPSQAPFGIWAEWENQDPRDRHELLKEASYKYATQAYSNPMPYYQDTISEQRILDWLYGMVSSYRVAENPWQMEVRGSQIEFTLGRYRQPEVYVWSAPPGKYGKRDLLKLFAKGGEGVEPGTAYLWREVIRREVLNGAATFNATVLARWQTFISGNWRSVVKGK